ncbi:MAG: LptA/OstA family protein [Candidatus Margulisiibacteriota bacterium]|nr:LptA/OstA family protein [Candidatus Margulisiibacteriota bacterium]
MDENLSWKIILVAAIFSLFVMGAVYYFISPRDMTYFSEDKTEKVAEFKDTRVSGRKDGKPLWEFNAKDGWSTKNCDVTHLFDVTKGKIYKSGKLVVIDLSAPRAKAYRRSDVVEVVGDKNNRVNAYLDLGRISNREKKDWTKMTADLLKYVPKIEETEISGNVNLHKKDSSIFTQRILIDNDKNIARMFDKVRLRRKDGILYSKKMEYHSDSERLEADENVRLTITENKVKTVIKANHASFYTDAARNMRLKGSVDVVQGKKFAVADSALYSQPRKSLYMKGSVKAIFEKARAVLKESTAKNLRSKEAKEILKEKTVLTSDELLFSTKTGDATATGSVLVTQKGREAKADRAVYNDGIEILTLTGKVYMKKKDRWVKAEKIIISVKDETFEAVGQVEAEFKL